MLRQDQTSALEILGYVYFRQGRLPQARIVFEGLAALDREAKMPRKHLAAISLAEGKPDEALLHLDAYLAGSIPGSAGLAALLMKAQAYWMAGREQESRQAVSEYLARSGGGQ